MESLTIFDLTSVYQETPHIKDWVAYTKDTDLLHLDVGREYKYVAHARLNITTDTATFNKNTGLYSARILGNEGGNMDITRIAKIRITNSNGESIVITPNFSYAFPNSGEYTLDYGVYEYESLPNKMFAGMPSLIYLQVDDDVLRIGSQVLWNNKNLRGALFGNEYPLIQVFEGEDYSENDVILGDHILSTGSLLGTQCGTVRNIYLGNSLTALTIGTICNGAKGFHLSKVYIGNNIMNYRNASNQLKGPGGGTFIYQGRIYEYVFSPEHPMFEWDPAVCSAVYKSNVLDNVPSNLVSTSIALLIAKGNTVIAIGGNGDSNGYLEVPENYFIPDYSTFNGKYGLRVVNMYNYKYIKNDNTYGTGTGYFFDCSGIRTWILPPNLTATEIYSGGKGWMQNLIIPVSKAPYLSYGTADGKFAGSIIGSGNNSGSMGNANTTPPNGNVYTADPDYNIRLLYVLNTDNIENKNSWTNEYDGTTSDTWGNERPNFWKRLQTKWTETSATDKSDKAHTFYLGFNINYREEYGEDGIRALINSFIPEGYNKLPTDAPTQDLN